MSLIGKKVGEFSAQAYVDEKVYYGHRPRFIGQMDNCLFLSC